MAETADQIRNVLERIRDDAQKGADVARQFTRSAVTLRGNARPAGTPNISHVALVYLLAPDCDRIQPQTQRIIR